MGIYASRRDFYRGSETSFNRNNLHDHGEGYGEAGRHRRSSNVLELLA